MKYLFIAILILTGCAHPKESTNSVHTNTVRFNKVVAFGDSITVGVGANQGYAQRIAAMTNSELSDYAIGSSVVNGFGSHIQQVLSNQSELQSGVAIVFLTGMNDVITGGDDPVLLQAYVDSVKTILDIFEASGAESYIGTTLKLTYNALEFETIMGKPTTAHSPTLHAKAIEELIHQQHYQHVHLVDTYNLFWPYDLGPNKNTDGVHPNDIGAEQIANIFYNSMGGF